ncbi:MAG: hypothetical protein AB4080_22125 [Trichodesmium sp.]
MHTCPCCSTKLLRHVRSNHIYWYCPHCREEMPDLNSMVLSRATQAESARVWLGISQQKSIVFVGVSA